MTSIPAEHGPFNSQLRAERFRNRARRVRKLREDISTLRLAVELDAERDSVGYWPHWLARRPDAPDDRTLALAAARVALAVAVCPDLLREAAR